MFQDEGRSYGKQHEEEKDECEQDYGRAKSSKLQGKDGEDVGTRSRTERDIGCEAGARFSAALWHRCLKWEEIAECTDVRSIKLLGASLPALPPPSTLPVSRAQSGFISQCLLPPGSQLQCEYPPHFYSLLVVGCSGCFSFCSFSLFFVWVEKCFPWSELSRKQSQSSGRLESSFPKPRASFWKPESDVCVWGLRGPCGRGLSARCLPDVLNGSEYINTVWEFRAVFLKEWRKVGGMSLWLQKTWGTGSSPFQSGAAGLPACAALLGRRSVLTHRGLTAKPCTWQVLCSCTF